MEVVCELYVFFEHFFVKVCKKLDFFIIFRCSEIGIPIAKFLLCRPFLSAYRCDLNSCTFIIV